MMEIAESLVPESDYWVSGLYYDEEGACPAVVVAQASGEIFDVSIFRYISLGLGPVSFLIDERLVWPVGADDVYHYTLIDESHLELSCTIPVAEIGEEDFWYELSGDVEDVARLFCRHLKKLIPLKDCDHDLSEIIETSEDHFRRNYASLLELDTPDFWA